MEAKNTPMHALPEVECTQQKMDTGRGYDACLFYGGMKVGLITKDTDFQSDCVPVANEWTLSTSGPYIIYGINIGVHWCTSQYH